MPAPLLLAIALAASSADVCPAPLAMPPELEAWRVAMYAPGNVKAVPPPASAAAYVAAYAAARKTDWADLCKYSNDNAQLLAQPATQRQVVFMGDSITEGWRYGDRSFFGPGWVDRGISGQTTPQMLLRFTSDVLALRPKVVHIMAGTNDVAGNTGPTSLDTIEANIKAMIVLAKADGIRVVFAATPPAASFKWKPDAKPAPQIAALNARLRALAAREHVTFVDYGTVLALPDGAMKPDLTFDGVHPAASGYAKMAPLAKRAIAEALAKK